jgi:hypothetical protein
MTSKKSERSRENDRGTDRGTDHEIDRLKGGSRLKEELSVDGIENLESVNEDVRSCWPAIF